MWRSVKSSRVKRHAEVRLRVYRRDPTLRPAPGPAGFARNAERLSLRMSRGIGRLRRAVGRVARRGLAQFLRVGNSARRDSDGSRRAGARDQDRA
jgi:hypothetical protein